jgi:hypothetical protein
MKKALLILTIITTFSSWGQEYVKNEILVQISPSTNAPDFFRNIESEFSFKSAKLISKPMNIYLVQFNQTINHSEVLRYFKSRKEVLAVQNNHYVTERETIPNDPELLTNQWHLKNTGQGGGTIDADIDATDAWDLSTGGMTTHNDTIVACIIEGSGVDITHEDLIDNIWKNYAEIPNNGIDDDNNGYVDDFLGWNVSTLTDDVGFGSHGTRVAGMVGAVGNNGIGISGVSQKVKMMIVKGQQASNEASVIAAYSYPLEMRKKYNQTQGQEGAFVVTTNASWGLDGGSPSNAPLWCAMYDSLGKAGILNVAATTNDNVNIDVVGDLPTTCPSDYLIAVTMTTNNDVRASSGYGPINVDLAAPGSGVYLTVPTNIYTVTSGTSFAAPCVTGAVALLYATPCPDFINWTKAYPDSSALKARALILNNVDLITNLSADVASGGRLNINNAMTALMSSCNTNACTAPYNILSNNITDTSATINWDGFSTNYLLYIQQNNQTQIDIPVNGSTTISFDTLTPCTNYTIKIKGICGSDTSDYSYPLLFTTDGCCSNPALAFSNQTPSTIEVNWAPVLYATNYDLRFKKLTDPNWTELLGITPPQIITNLDTCSDYEFQIKTICTDSTHGYSMSQMNQTKGCGACYDQIYCDVIGANSSAEWIESVSIENTIHTSGNNSGWLKEESVIFGFIPGTTSNITITPGYSGLNYTESFSVWIDLDQNGIFDSSEELINNFSNNGSISSILTIPSNTPNGITKMRVGMKTTFQGTLEACPSNNFYGEYEDYCIYIGPDASLTNSTESNISIYPNPVSSVININCQSPISVLTIKSLDGKIVFEDMSNINKINVSFLPKGLYFIEITTKGRKKIIKFIKV